MSRDNGENIFSTWQGIWIIKKLILIKMKKRKWNQLSNWTMQT
jgi:hypothetical protein